MKKLLKVYSFDSDMQYFEMIADSFTNGQFSQAKEQFRSMPKNDRINFLKSATVGGWNSGIAEHNLSVLFENM